MSAREEKGGAIAPRTTAEIEDEIDALEALQFAKGTASHRGLPVTGVLEENTNAPEILPAESQTTSRESMDAVARRLAMKVELVALSKLAETIPAQQPTMRPPAPDRLPARASPRALLPESGAVSDSFITVPPTAASVPPPDIPPAPLAPSIPDVAPDRTLRLAPMTPAFAIAITASRHGAVRRGAWAVLLSMVAVALPGALILHQALIPHPANTRSARPAVAPTVAPETDAVPTTTADSTEPPGALTPGTATPNLNTAWDPADPQLATRKPHSTRHTKGKSAPKPSPSPAASSAKTASSAASPTIDPSAKYGF